MDTDIYYNSLFNVPLYLTQILPKGATSGMKGIGHSLGGKG